MPSNPWLTVPLEDYEGHMDSPGVRQLAVLATLFARVLTLLRPRSVAVLGVAGGNGLNHIDPAVSQRVVGVDVHPDYLAEVGRRYPAPFPLELHCLNLATQRVDFAPVQLVHAALIFEHAGAELALRNAVASVAEGGALSVVLQLPSAAAAGVAATPFASIQALKSGFTLIEPLWLTGALRDRGFTLIEEQHEPLAEGKAFWMGVFRAP